MVRRYARSSVRYRARSSASSRVFARKKRNPKKAVVLILAAVMLVIGGGKLLASSTSGGTSTASPVPASSTPASEWEKGSVPYLYQTDPEWADWPYAGGTVEENGCGPTCLSMVYICLTGRKDFGPGEMAIFSEREGHVDSGMTSWTLMSSGAAELGLMSEELPADEAAVLSALSQGRPVICSVGPGDFTTTGHFIVLAGLDESGGVVVHDPNSEARSRQPWEIGRILPQCRNLWAFSAA